MEILVLSAHLPCAQARQAGQKNTYYLCQWLARRHSVHLLGFATDRELEFINREEMAFLQSFGFVRVTSLSRAFGALTNPNLPLLAAARHSGSFRRKLRNLINKQKFDVCLLDFTGMMQYGADLNGVQVVGVLEADLGFRMWERQSTESRNRIRRAAAAVEARRTRRWELNHLQQMDFVLVHNSEEMKAIKGLLPGVSVRVLDVWAELWPKEDLGPYCKREPDSLAFWGAMDRQENLDAATYAAERLLPRIWKRRPQVSYWVAGNRPPASLIDRYRDSRVKVCGYVEKPFSFLAQKQLALLPMRLGAGIKVKVLECMAAGLPVVTTPAGAEGIPGKEGLDYLVGKSEEELTECTLSLLATPERAEEMSIRARQTVLNEHDFEGSLEDIEAHILQRLKNLGTRRLRVCA